VQLASLSRDKGTTLLNIPDKTLLDDFTPPVIPRDVTLIRKLIP